MEPIQVVLERRKIRVDPVELARVLEEALDAAGGYPHPQPRGHLTSEQIELLARGGFDVDGPDLGLRDPLLRGALEYAAMRATALTTKEAAARLNVNDSRIRQRLAERELYGIKAEDGWRLPAFQFEATGKLVPHIDRIVPHLPENLSAIAVLHWFTSSNPDLASAETRDEPVSPLDWLRLGLDPEPVVELASQL